MSKQGLMHAAMAAASIATFLTVHHGEASTHDDWSDDNDAQMPDATGTLQRIAGRHLPEQTLKVGQTVRWVGYPHRSNANKLRVKRLPLSDRTITRR